MADVNTIRSAAGSRAAQIDEGLRAHMNKVYATMSVGMLITAAAAWAISGLAVTTDPSAAAAQIGLDPVPYAPSVTMAIAKKPGMNATHIANAVEDALGLRVKSMPITAEKIANFTINGEKIADGTPDEVSANQDVIDAYLGVPH